MNFRPLLGFYWKHSSQIEVMFAKGSTGEGSNLLVDLVTAIAPVIKKHWPSINANALLDDAVTTIKEALAPDDQPPAPMLGGAGQ